MTKRATEFLFTGETTPYASYDSSKTNLGTLIQQQTGLTSEDKYAGPIPISVARPMEASVAIASIYPHALEVNQTDYWVFLADNSTAAATRRISLYRYRKDNNSWSWRGFVTLTFPTATVHTIRGFRVVRHLETTGTVAVSGTTVTGSGTTWQSDRYAVGSRIGFGSTNPDNITEWFYVTAIGSNTSITLSITPGTITAGTSFVIEDLRIYVVTTNATATNGGLFVAKGINYDDFVPAGTTIPAATTVDNIKAVYWLADAATVLNVAAGGMGMGSVSTDTSCEIYVTNVDAATTLRIYKYDGRAALTVASGRSTNAFLFRTGQQTVTGNLSQTNAARICTLQHGPGSGQSNLYTATTSRILRCPESGISNGAVSFVSDAMVEIPTGGTSTFAATGAMSSVEYSANIDRLIITTATGSRNYVTKYNTNSDPFDHVFLVSNQQTDQSAASIDSPPFPGNQLGAYSIWSEAGILFAAKIGTTAIINTVYAIPLSADWTYASVTNQRLITPSISTPNCLRYSKVIAMHKNHVGDELLGLQTEPFRIYFRTSGIIDDSGTWQLIEETGDISAISGSNTIQFMFEFRMIGTFCLPSRIFGLVVTYEDSSTDSHYQPSVALSSVVSKRFAWRFSTAFGGTVPTLTVNLYDAVTNSLLLTDTTASSVSGTWEKSTDGSTWGAYNTTDKSNNTTYIRYTPTSLADNIRVRAQLTQ